MNEILNVVESMLLDIDDIDKLNEMSERLPDEVDAIIEGIIQDKEGF